jgi:hypothetical protein
VKESILMDAFPTSIGGVFQGIDGLKGNLGQAMLLDTRLPPRHWRVTPTPTGTRVSTCLLRMVSPDRTINKTATKPTVNKLFRSSSSKSSKRSGRK